MEHKGFFLPHINPYAEKFFVTFVLFSDKIAEFYAGIKKEQKVEIKKLKDLNDKESFLKISIIRKKYFDIFDSFLGKNPVEGIDLTQENIAEIIIERLKLLDGKLYKLGAYCIMSNHVHILFDTAEQLKNIDENVEINSLNFVNVSKIMQLIKGATSFEINKILNRKGTLWLRDYWDHLVRNEKEFTNIANYIAQNPVKAGLVDDWTKWRFTQIFG